jgi:hypothetical protein
MELKRKSMSWGKIIFPRDSLPLFHLTDEQATETLRLICNEMSQFYPGDLFMPHLIMREVDVQLTADDYNDCELELAKSMLYDIVTMFADIIFQGINEFATLTLRDMDESNITIAYQISPKENF